MHFVFISLSSIGHWTSAGYVYYNFVLILLLLWAIKEQDEALPLQLVRINYLHQLPKALLSLHILVGSSFSILLSLVLLSYPNILIWFLGYCSKWFLSDNRHSSANHGFSLLPKRQRAVFSGNDNFASAC